MMYEKCREVLLREYELVQNARAVQEKIRFAVINREWTDFEGHFKDFGVIENELATMEIARENLFAAFDSGKNQADQKDDKGRFYAMACTLPENQRNELTSIYRSLKLEALKLRMDNDTLMTYLAEVKATLTDFFAFVFPDRGGKMYTKTGTHFTHDMRSMVLNQRF